MPSLHLWQAKTVLLVYKIKTHIHWEDSDQAWSMCLSQPVEFPTPGLISQVKDNLTHNRYRVATVFVDHFSDLTYVHFSQSDTSEEIVEVKKAFKCVASTHGVTIEHYHANNGCFVDNLLCEAIQHSGQSITYCGIWAHHQNGIAEWRICDLMKHARTML